MASHLDSITRQVNGVFTMSRSRRILERLVAATVLAACCAGCRNNTQTGAAVGGVGGAALGALIGNATGNAAAGAAIGGVTGLAAGALAGNAEDEAERSDAYARQAAYERHMRIRQQRAVTNSDVINMAANGVTDNVICNEIRTRGGSFDTSPNAIIYLQRAGVSDRVLETMQNCGGY